MQGNVQSVFHAIQSLIADVYTYLREYTKGISRFISRPVDLPDRQRYLSDEHEL